jgi:hypothetical protein
MMPTELPRFDPRRRERLELRPAMMTPRAWKFIVSMVVVVAIYWIAGNVLLVLGAGCWPRSRSARRQACYWISVCGVEVARWPLSP